MNNYAELVINIEAALENTFHYHVPRDLAPILRVGHLVEVEFGRRLAQGIIIAFDSHAPVEDTKPIISLIDVEPVVLPWQVELAQWLSSTYLAPLNGCLRLMLPPGLTRWADVTLDINPHWDGRGRLTERQQALVDLLRERGDLRGRQITRALGKKSAWQTAANQLVRRHVLRKATVLDPPRVRPKQVRTVELIAGREQIIQTAVRLGRRNKQADVLLYLLQIDDPLPAETAVLEAANAQEKHLQTLADAGFITRAPGQTITADDAAIIIQPATISLAVSEKKALQASFHLRQAEKYAHILDYLAQAAPPTAVREVYAATNTNLSHLRKLAEFNLVRLGTTEIWRDPLADRDFVPVSAPILTTDQARVWGRVKMGMLSSQEDPESAPPRVLLHGVTGSGKTEIYMRAIDFALQQGQRAVVLVPEIALTPQTVRRFSARFPGRVAILHSRLSDGERYDTWRRARLGQFDIIIGPRSALFTPLANLGVIVVDEEHDGSYKQTPPVPPPYYHARETAVALGQITGAAVIMGSATPDVVSYHHARSGRYQLLELPRRVMGHRQRISAQAARLHVASQYHQLADDPDDALTIPLPPIQVVDLRQELRAGNRSIFSRALERALDETLARGEQAILYLNRRGTASFVMCRDCGHVLKCPRCDTPLTYHRPRLMLVCHHCGRREPQQQECPVCGSKRIKYFGLGTEQVETLVQQRWPQARITRWDRDTTAGKDSHEALLASFVNQEADILVGTQMIAKGLDLPFVTLVGVISADVALGLPDYRTGERAFQNLAQVAGRAGRGLLGGRVIIQTYQPEHYAIQAAAEHDYATFFIDEIRFRTQHTLPPFRRLAKLVLVDPVNARAEREARKLAAALKMHIREKALAATDIVGPVPPFFNRIDGRYRWQILVRSPDPIRLLADFPVPRPWILDIDPVSTL